MQDWVSNKISTVGPTEQHSTGGKSDIRRREKTRGEVVETGLGLVTFKLDRRQQTGVATIGHVINKTANQKKKKKQEAHLSHAMSAKS